MADYDQAISLDPKLAEAYNNRRAARADQGDLAGAIADYDQVSPMSQKRRFLRHR
jgi:hypothetical protein